MRGRCRGIDSSIFFSPDSERGTARARRESRAKQICEGCPVLVQCRDHALNTGEPYGVWGGMTELDRKRQARRRRGGVSHARDGSTTHHAAHRP